MRTVERFKRMFQIMYLYAARFIAPEKTKRLSAAEKPLLLESGERRSPLNK